MICSQSTDSVSLCDECAHYLVSNHAPIAKDARNYKYTWPSFFWSLLSNENVHHAYGSQAWNLIPFEMRHWWIDAVKELPGNTFEDISIRHPEPIVIDKTTDLSTFLQKMESFDLANLRDGINEHLFPIVLCPWGCTSYCHHSGHIEMDILIQRYIPKCFLSLCNDHSSCAFAMSA